MLDFPPSGLRPPDWWGIRPAAAADDYDPLHGGLPTRWLADPLTFGVVLSGAVLGEVGLMAAQVNPDHAVIYLAEAVD